MYQSIANLHHSSQSKIMLITGINKTYAPGDAVSAVITLDNRKEGGMAIISSDMYLKRREGIRYTSIPCPPNKLMCTTWDVKKHLIQRSIAKEETGLSLRIFNRIIGKGRTMFHAEFHVPVDASNSSVVPGVYGNTHYNEYFVHAILEVSRGGISWTLEKEVPFRVVYSIPTNTSSMTSGVQTVGARQGISSMVRCSTHGFAPGEEFDLHVAIINNTGKNIRKVVAYFSQVVRVISDDVTSAGRLESRTGKRIRTITIPREERSDSNFVEIMEHVLESGYGTHLRLSVPSDFIHEECRDARVIRRYIVVKFHFYMGSSCEMRFGVME